MADFGTPIVNPAGSNSAGQALSLADAVLGYRQKQQALQLGQAEVQQQQQTASQRAGIANWFQNFDAQKFTGPDGTLDLNAVLTNPELRQAAGDQYPDVVGKMLALKQNQIVAQKSLLDLTADSRDQLFQQVGALRTDPDVVAGTQAGKDKAEQALNAFASTSPAAARVAQLYGQFIDNMPPEKMAQGLSNMQLQATSVSQQAAQQAPAYTDVGGTLRQVNPQAAGGNLGVQPNLTKTIAPGIATTTIGGNPYAFNVQNPGRVAMVGQGEGLNVRPPVMLPNQPEIEKNIDMTREAGDQVGASRAVNARIMSLLQNTTTGPGTHLWQTTMAAIGMPTGSTYQELGAFLDRQAAQAQTMMGLPHTNAGLESAQMITGNTGLNNKVIADKTRFVDALQTATGAYRAGMEKALGNPVSPDYAAYQKYRAAWAKDFNPEVFEYTNALEAGDTATVNRIKKELGSRGMQKLAEQYQKLKALSGGQQ